MGHFSDWDCLAAGSWNPFKLAQVARGEYIKCSQTLGGL